MKGSRQASLTGRWCDIDEVIGSSDVAIVVMNGEVRVRVSRKVGIMRLVWNEKI